MEFLKGISKLVIIYAAVIAAVGNTLLNEPDYAEEVLTHKYLSNVFYLALWNGVWAGIIAANI